MKPLTIIPQEIAEAIAKGAVLAVSISGGKDSQALLKVVCDWHRANSLTNRIFAIHADLGQSEWKQTQGYVEKLCKDNGVELVVVQAQRDGETEDLIQRVERRMKQQREAGKDEPPWPSPKARFCTSDLKTKPINDYLRQFPVSISVEGICWHESAQRSTKPRIEKRTAVATCGRISWTWNAIIDYTLDEVWGTHGQSCESHKKAIGEYEQTGVVPGCWNFHPVYAMGNTRLSCSICIMGSKGDYLNGVKHNPDYADEIHRIEVETGYTMKQGISIAQARELLKQGKL